MLTLLKTLFQPKKTNAALAWQHAGNDAGVSYWLFAAPVHLVLQRDSFSLAEPAPLPLQPDEFDALTSTLNQHFSIDDLQFFWHETTWFLSLKINPNIQTMPLQSVINKDIHAFLPTGEGAMQWAKFQNEIQMLLFNHPVNLAREANKLPPVNSIWCYGLGFIENNKNAN